MNLLHVQFISNYASNLQSQDVVQDECWEISKKLLASFEQPLECRRRRRAMVSRLNVSVMDSFLVWPGNDVVSLSTGAGRQRTLEEGCKFSDLI